MSTHRRALAVTIGILMLGIGLLATPAHAANGYTGSWAAVDVLDGSGMTLSVTGNGPHVGVRMVDDGATVCGGGRATLSGSGQLDEEHLVAHVSATCQGGGTFSRRPIHLAWLYDAGTDTLSDPDGNTWHRV